MNLYYLEITAALSTIASFSWGLKYFFVRTGEATAPVLKLAAIVGLVGSFLNLVCLFFFNEGAFYFSLIGNFLYVAATVLFWWTVKTNREKPLTIAFSTDQPQHLVTHGPYRLVRNPFYLSYMLAWVAGFFVTNQWILIVVALAMFVFYDRAARAEEKKFLSSNLSGEYQAYFSKTWRFLPGVY